MSSGIPLRCRCGKLRGTLHAASPAAGNRLVCMCDDCQAYAYQLGCAQHVLDANGGTGVVGPSELEVLRQRVKRPPSGDS